MTSEEHNKTLATLYFIYGAMHGLTLVGLLLLVFVVGIASPRTFSVSTFWIVVAIVAFLVLLIAVGLLPLVVGYGLLKRRRWTRPLGLGLAIISLINIPVGTALGIYTFKFLKSEGGVKLYGGSVSAANENDLQKALRGAQPLTNLSKRIRQ